MKIVLPYECVGRRTNLIAVAWAFIAGFILCWILFGIFSVSETQAMTSNEHDMLRKKEVRILEDISNSLRNIDKKLER